MPGTNRVCIIEYGIIHRKDYKYIEDLVKCMYFEEASIWSVLSKD